MTVHTPQTPSAGIETARTDVRPGALIGAALALVATLTIFAIGMIGAPIRVLTGWAPDGADLTVLEVVLTVAVALALGAILLAVLQQRLRRGWTIWVIVVATAAVGSAVPLFGLDIDLQSKLALASMHLATGSAAIAGHTAARNLRRGQRGVQPRTWPARGWVIADARGQDLREGLRRGLLATPDHPVGSPGHPRRRHPGL